MFRSLIALTIALTVGGSLAFAGGLVAQGGTSSFASQRSSVTSAFQTTPSGIVTNLAGNQASNTGSDSTATASSTIPNTAAAVDSWGSGSTWGGVVTQIQASGTGFNPVALSGSASQDAMSSSRASAEVSTFALPACFRTCW